MQWYNPKPALAIVSETARACITEHGYVNPHIILNALLEHGYVHAEWPEGIDPGSHAAWITPLDSVHCACLGDPGTATAHTCNTPLGTTIHGNAVDIHWDSTRGEHALDNPNTTIHNRALEHYR